MIIMRNVFHDNDEIRFWKVNEGEIEYSQPSLDPFNWVYEALKYYSFLSNSPDSPLM